MPRPRLRRALAALLALLAPALPLACGSPTDDGPPPVELRGSWHYTAEQTSPASATLDGDLEITDQSGHQLGGSIDVVESSALGDHRLTGVVSGQVPDASSVDFDVFFTSTARRHVGEIRADTIVGTWAEFGSSGGATGTFRAERRPAP